MPLNVCDLCTVTLYTHERKLCCRLFPGMFQALEKLPWTRGRTFSFIVSSIIFLNTVPGHEDLFESTIG